MKHQESKSGGQRPERASQRGGHNANLCPQQREERSGVRVLPSPCPSHQRSPRPCRQEGWLCSCMDPECWRELRALATQLTSAGMGSWSQKSCVLRTQPNRAATWARRGRVLGWVQEPRCEVTHASCRGCQGRSRERKERKEEADTLRVSYALEESGVWVNLVMTEYSPS